MTTSTFTLRRHEDPSGVSGVGDVAWGAEFPDGSVAVRWPGDHPSTASWGDIRDVEAVHGHQGKTVVTYTGSDRLLAAYQTVVPLMLITREPWQPLQVKPHPDHPDRLRLICKGEQQWTWWLNLLDGSPDAAVHEEVNGETEHRWISSDGSIWLTYYTPLTDARTPLQRFHEEDR